jgi:hypothetical protein
MVYSGRVISAPSGTKMLLMNLPFLCDENRDLFVLIRLVKMIISKHIISVCVQELQIRIAYAELKFDQKRTGESLKCPQTLKGLSHGSVKKTKLQLGQGGGGRGRRSVHR